MNKRVVMLGAIVGMIAGAYLPALWGDTHIFSVASILLGMLGGFVGIYLAVWLGKRLG